MNCILPDDAIESARQFADTDGTRNKFHKSLSVPVAAPRVGSEGGAR